MPGDVHRQPPRRDGAIFAYSPKYTLDWPGHVFPALKYRQTVDWLVDRGMPRSRFFEPEPAPFEWLALVHRREYLERLEKITAHPELGYYEFEAPCSREVLDAFYAMTGGTVACARRCLLTGIAANIGGGFHHAFAGHGEGFCAIHDVAVAIRILQKEGSIAKAAVIDLDVHQGNGTAVLFQEDPLIFTFSMHQENNYPVKQRSSRDIGLDDGTGDAEYLSILRKELPGILDQHRPDIVAYVAGADPFREDQLGGLALTFEGLAERDALVFDECSRRGVPLFVTLAGGYSRAPGDVVRIHGTTLELAAALADRGPSPQAC
jgi:acetoin utilization deacetylase AcuC-like enzyme